MLDGDLVSGNCVPKKRQLIYVVALFVAFAGCGGDDLRQRTYPAAGQVLLDGKPLVGATVVLHAKDKSKFRWQELPQGKTDSAGKFQLFTYQAGDGAPAAEYNVGIALLDVVADDGGDQVKHDKAAVKVPKKYNDASTSGLTATIGTKATELPPFELSSR